MKVKELIEKIEALPAEDYKYRPYIDKKVVLALVRQLDEPEKVKVSEEEAKFLETFNLNHRSDVTKTLYYISRVGFGYCLTNNDGLELRGLSEEFWDFENRKRLIKAILDGYEVDKEPKYLVKIKSTEQYLEKTGSAIRFSSLFKSSFKKKELEQAGFGWVFDCP